MLRITYDGKELDIDISQDMFMSYASTDLSNLSVREGGFNNTWQLPATANNLAVFGNLNEPTGSLDAAYVFKPVMIYNDGTAVFNGLGRVTEVRMNAISLLVVDALGGLASLLDTKLEDLKWFSLDGPEGSMTTELGVNNREWLDDSTSLYVTGHNVISVFAKIYNGFTERIFRDAGGSVAPETVPMAALSPWFNLRRLTQLTLEKLGYNVFIDEPSELEKMTYIGGTQRASDGRFLTYQDTASGADEPFFWQPAAGPAAEQVVPLRFSNGVGDNNRITMHATAQGVMRVRVRCKIKYLRPPNEPSIGLRLKYQSSYRTYNAYELRLTIVSNSEQTYQLDQTMLFRLDELGQTATPNTEQWLELRAFIIAGGSGDNYIQIEANDLSISFEPLDLLADMAPLTGRCVGDLTCGDLITEYMNRFGKLINVNESSKLVVFGNISSLAVIGRAVDWTQKMCVPDGLKMVGPYETTFIYGDLAQRNTYANEGGLGGGILVTETTTGEVEREVYASPFTVLPDVQQTLNALNALGTIMPDFERTNDDDYELYTSTRGYIDNDLVYCRNGWIRVTYNTGSPETRPYPYPYVYNSSRLDPPAPITQWRPVDVPYQINHVPGIALMYTPDGATPLLKAGVYNDAATTLQVQDATDIPTPLFAAMFWQPLLNSYYAPLATALARPRVDKYYVQLSVADVANLDFSRPVLINGAYYYIVLIDQLDIVNPSRPTPVVLLRLA